MFCTAAAQSTASLTDLVLGLNHAPAGSLTAMSLPPDRAKVFEAALRSLAAGDLAAARQDADGAGYDILEVVQSGGVHHVLIERAPVAIGPLVVLAVAPSRDIIVSAPHPVIDRATGLQSALAYQRLDARALIVAGSSRCAATQESPCSGKTAVCGSRGPYRSSDGAHNPDSLFHLAHAVLGRLWPESVTLQLHGFARKETDAWVVLSDGTGEKRHGGAGLPERVRDRIRTRLGGAEKAVSCQDPADSKYSFRRLCAQTNVQGRALNGSADICRSNAAVASGRFLHVEQSWDIRAPVHDRWREIGRFPDAMVVADALADVIPCALRICR